MDLITKIRKNTSALHKATESSGFIKRLSDINASNESYAEYLFNLSAMYKAIEDTIENNSSNETVRNFVTKELFRYELIQKDLKFLVGDKLESMELLPSTLAFVDKIKEINKYEPELIVAYAYTRFLADLFGGRTFAKLLSEKYEISTDALNYYNCEGIDDIRTYVMNYASKINNMNLSKELEDKFIVEVNNAYIYNLAISSELEAKLY
ncbi:heme oxygenase (biliverdin-producing) [Romboutsia sp.]|uniref:biliverdin-producing heme oxygenase n=1 Tax=Romboutsia sp. TaxID=1965302 RepID=UPI003F39BEEB